LNLDEFVGMIERILAFIILILLLPFLVAVFLIIFVEDGYPFIFKQFRVGQFGRVFVFYKIRTMRKETPELSTSDIQETGNWVLKTGYYLRKFSVDESLNLLNIIKGDMSFIGPRPLIVSEKYMHEQRKKLGIINQKPGITGWAQINGRDVISDDRKLKLEKYYLDNISLKLKAVILLKTVFYIFWTVRQKLSKPKNKL
jgi:O-antigen biosynthesis protein WbqP